MSRPETETDVHENLTLSPREVGLETSTVLKTEATDPVFMYELAEIYLLTGGIDGAAIQIALNNSRLIHSFEN